MEIDEPGDARRCEHVILTTPVVAVRELHRGATSMLRFVYFSAGRNRLIVKRLFTFFVMIASPFKSKEQVNLLTCTFKFGQRRRYRKQGDQEVACAPQKFAENATSTVDDGVNSRRQN